MNYEIFYTPEFKKNIKSLKKNKVLLKELEQKVFLLKSNPCIIGKNLRGRLFPNKSLRVASKFRLVFEIRRNSVILKAISHRKSVYNRLN